MIDSLGDFTNEYIIIFNIKRNHLIKIEIFLNIWRRNIVNFLELNGIVSGKFSKVGIGGFFSKYWYHH